MSWAASRGVRPLLAALALASILASWLYEQHELGMAAETGAFAYPAIAPAAACAANASGAIRAQLQTDGGIAFTASTPSNYDARYPHALLVVFAPAGADRGESERFTGLTRAATRAGFVVVYADHAALKPAAIRDLGTIPERVAQVWCIDRRRIFLTGHSDGGTVATALALSAAASGRYAGIAPSAAGFTAADLKGYSCPAPLAVLVAHAADDELFPGYGREAAAWWAACNQCDAAPPARRADGCIEYTGCAGGVRTRYCEHPGRRARWPARNQMLLEFFAADAAAS